MSRRHVLHADTALIHGTAAVSGLLGQHRHFRRREALLGRTPTPVVCVISAQHSFRTEEQKEQLPWCTYACTRYDFPDRDRQLRVQHEWGHRYRYRYRTRQTADNTSASHKHVYKNSLAWHPHRRQKLASNATTPFSPQKLTSHPTQAAAGSPQTSGPCPAKPPSSQLGAPPPPHLPPASRRRQSTRGHIPGQAERDAGRARTAPSFSPAGLPKTRRGCC